MKVIFYYTIYIKQKSFLLFSSSQQQQFQVYVEPQDDSEVPAGTQTLARQVLLVSSHKREQNHPS